MPPTKRRTLGEIRYDKRPNLTTIRKWNKQFATTMLGSVWQGFDLLVKEALQYDVTKAEDDLERTITEWLDPRIRRFVDEYAPYYLQHNTGERETRNPSPAMPPQYDLAFVFWENEEMKWPLEAKVLLNDSMASITDYVRCLKTKVLACKYAPFSSEAAMLGYLFSGSPNKVYSNIAAKVPCTLSHHPHFGGRHHKISNHLRAVPSHKKGIYPARFKCHHLMLGIGNNTCNPSEQPQEAGWLFG